MYIPRHLYPTLAKALQYFPAVLITGPRQSGKTTFLLQEGGKGYSYVSFDDPLERNFAISDPNGFLDRFDDKPVILDEIQYVPEILPYLKIRIDILELLPFSWEENKQVYENNVESVIWLGGYPEPSLIQEKRDLWIRSYIQTYIERDIRQLHNVTDLRQFELFTTVCAARHGQSFNMADISRQTGISQPTVKSWAGILEASYITFFLPPYFKNFGKRLNKAPKIYFLDTALVCSLTRQPSGSAALAGSMGGAFFEGWVVGETIKAFTSLGRKPDIYFWRSHDGLEVDLLIQIGTKIHPVEIKLTATPTPNHLNPLNSFKKLLGGDASETGILVCRVKETKDLPENNLAMPWHAFPKWLRGELQSV
jgi:predicted AAA+ superfamily ATPase